MKCPYCNHLLQSKPGGDQVLETRRSPNEKSIRRRRLCSSCKKKFTTREFTVLDLQHTLDLKQSIISQSLVIKVSDILEDGTSLMSNLQDLKCLLEKQLDDAQDSMIDSSVNRCGDRFRTL